MKKTTAIVIALLTTTSLAHAQSIEAITAQLVSEGYTNIEIENNGTTVEIEAEKGSEERELMFDAATFALLEDVTSTNEATDDDENEVDDENEADDDEDDDDNEADDDNADEDDDDNDDEENDD